MVRSRFTSLITFGDSCVEQLIPSEGMRKSKDAGLVFLLSPVPQIWDRDICKAGDRIQDSRTTREDQDR
jgi:hypothetical protein